MTDPVTTEGRPKRRLFTFWRVVAVLALALAGYAVFLADAEEDRGPHVALHEVFGVISVDRKRAALLREIAEDPDAAALVVAIDSPGGTTTGSEQLFDALRAVAERKPVVAVMGEVAASGGYIAAMAADHLIAYGNTLTGSIGVIAQQPDVRGLLSNIGVEIRERRSDVYKARPSPFSETPPEVEAWEAELIADSYGWFRGLVGERRGLEGAALDRVADGRVFTGRQALEAGLVDEIGGVEAARVWLAGRGVDAALPLVPRAVEAEPTSWLIDLLTSRLPAVETLRLDAWESGTRLYSLMR